MRMMSSVGPSVGYDHGSAVSSRYAAPVPVHRHAARGRHPGQPRPLRRRRGADRPSRDEPPVSSHRPPTVTPPTNHRTRSADADRPHPRRALRRPARLPVRAALRRRSTTATAATLRVHYLDEGPADAAPVLLMHGEPSWSYLYRHMIPPLVDGRPPGDRPRPGRLRSQRQAHRAGRLHLRPPRRLDVVSSLFDRLDLRDITFFGQDWGGLVGLRLVAADPDRYARVVIGNTGLPTGHGPASEAFLAWQKFSQETPTTSRSAASSTAAARTELAPEVVAAYDAPFPDDSYKAGARIFPTLVPTSPDDPASADNARRVEGARVVRPAVPARLQRPRPDHQGRRRAVPGQGARRPGPAPHHHRGRRPLPAGGRGPELAQVMIDFIAAR